MTTKRRFHNWGVRAGLALAIWGAGARITAAAVPHQINFQGVLKDGSGDPVANGPYAVIFALYDAATLGSVYWAETTTVSTVSGLFNATLGSIHPIPDGTFADSSRGHLGERPPDSGRGVEARQGARHLPASRAIRPARGAERTAHTGSGSHIEP